MNKLIEKIVLLALFIALLGSGYIFIVTIFLRETTFAGFFNTWHFPMLLAIFIDISCYKHVNNLYTL
jgi:hypothetical protein